MRALILLSVLAGVALLPLAAGDTCVPTCDVTTAAMRFFVPAVSVVQSGSALSWLAGDGIGHTATDLTDFCFHVGFGTTVPGSVTFEIRDGVLLAGENGGVLAPCATPALADGSFLLEYLCGAHPQMKGNILVVQ